MSIAYILGEYRNYILSKYLENIEVPIFILTKNARKYRSMIKDNVNILKKDDFKHETFSKLNRLIICVDELCYEYVKPNVDLICLHSFPRNIKLMELIKVIIITDVKSLLMCILQYNWLNNTENLSKTRVYKDLLNKNISIIITPKINEITIDEFIKFSHNPDETILKPILNDIIQHRNEFVLKFKTKYKKTIILHLPNNGNNVDTIMKYITSQYKNICLNYDICFKTTSTLMAEIGDKKFKNLEDILYALKSF